MRCSQSVDGNHCGCDDARRTRQCCYCHQQITVAYTTADIFRWAAELKPKKAVPKVECEDDGSFENID